MSAEHPLDATVRFDYEYRRLFRIWAEDPTRENWDAMNRAADELDRATDRLIKVIEDKRQARGDACRSSRGRVP